MTVKGINHWVTWKDPAKGSSSEVENGVEDFEKDLSQADKTAVRVYLSHLLRCHLLRLIVSIFILCTLIVFIKQSKYTVISIDHMKTMADFNKDNLDDTKYDLTDNGQELIARDKYEYDIVILEETYEVTEPKQCANIQESFRFDCYPEKGVSERTCAERGCCWDSRTKKMRKLLKVPLNVPYCYYPDNWQLYDLLNFTDHGTKGFDAFLKQIAKSPYKKNVPLVKIERRAIDNSIMRIKVFDPLNKRYEPPIPVKEDRLDIEAPSNPKYKTVIDDTKPGFQISRMEDDTVLFDARGIGGFIFADQFLQIQGVLSSHNIYGLGEHKSNLKLDTNWTSFTFFNRDLAPVEKANLYGTHPFLLIIEDTGNAHGILFLNSNAMDVILQPAPAITFRTIGGVFDMYFFLGPTPADVIRQYSQIVGKPFLPPYWSLGFHLCRYGYRSLENTKEVWNRTRAAGIPFDTQWNDLDYMDKNNDFTVNGDKFKDLSRFIEDLHSMGMHYIPLIDAGISGSEANGTYLPYDQGLKQDIFVKGAGNRPFIGKVWNYVSTVWPDYTNPKTNEYYLDMLRSLHKNIAFDGAWIDMNEPSNFYDGLKNGCPKNDLDYPEYVPNVVGGLLSAKTLCMNAKHYLGSHYNLHNTYGTSQAIATNYALTKIRQKRPFIISRSTWVGHGKYAGHWSGDVFSTWHDLKMSIPETLSFSLFQIPMMGADICGFNGNTTASLCNRWMQLGAFYPFSRNHNSDDTREQDPVALGDLVVKSSKRALTIRYWLLPYLYTLFFKAHKFGDTVARPLFVEFPKDPATYDIDTQFLWGSSLLINPVLDENKTSVKAYLPRGLWYDLYTKKAVFATGRTYTLDAPLDTIPLMIRGGSILPAQKPGVTTTESRTNSFELIVALDDKRQAKGEFYWDDGDSLASYENKQFLWLSFFVKNEILTSTEIEHGSFGGKVIVGRIQILGVASEVYQVLLNEKSVDFKYDADSHCLSITGLHLNLRKRFTLHWDYSHSELHNVQNST